MSFTSELMISEHPADDNRHRQVENVSPHDECFEFFEHNNPP